MRRALLTLLFAVSVPAATRSLPLVATEPTPAMRRETKLEPIPFFYNELDAQRGNQGLLGRKNGTRDEQRVAETPSLQPRPLSSW